MQNLDPKMTRTTRVLYVEEMEVSDTETENTSKSFKSFEMETKVESRKSSDNGTASGAAAGTGTSDASTSAGKRSTTPSNAWSKDGPAMAEPTKATEPQKEVPLVPAKMPKMFAGTVGPHPLHRKTTSHRSLKAHKSMHDSEELKTIEESMLYETLHPLFICMKASGIFYIRRKRTADRKDAIKNCTLLQAYCVLLCVILMANFLRSLLAFDSFSFDSRFMFKGLASILFYESVTRALLAYWQCSRKTQGIQQFFLNLESTCYPDGIIPYETPLKRTMYFFIGLTFFIGFANVAVTAYGLFGPPKLQDLFSIYLVPLPADVQGVEGAKALMLILTFINTQVAILSLSFYTVVCYLLFKEFEYMCRTFSMKIGSDGSFTDDLEKFRQRHQKRCKLVEAADGLFKYYIGNTYLTNVPLLCLLLYSMVNAENDVAYRFISGFRLAYVLIQMIVLSVAATMINDQAHAPLADIYSIRVHSTTSERQLEVNMFLNKLTGTSIGLTAWDMFVINKPTLLTVIGMILTYFFLLVQFKNPLEGSAACECTFKAANGTNYTLPTLD